MGLIILLSVLGLLLVVAEIILIPGIFITGALGIASLFGSCYMAFDTFGESGGWLVTSINILLCLVVLVLTLRSKTWKKMALETSIQGSVEVPEINQLQVGASGTALSRINPMGKAQFGGQVCEVMAQEGWINEMETIEILRIEDHKIIVKRKHQ